MDRAQFYDEVVFQTALVRIGAFRCDADHAAFPRSAPIVNHCVWFSRTPVVIQPQHERSFIANANIATFYNRGELFGRRRVAARGDESDWFAVEESLACRIVDACSSPGRGQAGPFPCSHVTIDSATYFRQRALFERATAASPADALSIEEGVVDLVEHAILQASSGGREGLVPSVLSRHRALARDVEVVLSAEFDRPLSLTDLARRVGTSVYHLCRVFRAVTGSTMHQYRQRLRLRAALEAVTGRGATLTQIAVSLGFPSHSHFTKAFRLEFGVLPSALRRSSRSLPGGTRAVPRRRAR
jgi:AraC-like DNA-binding protein